MNLSDLSVHDVRNADLLGRPWRRGVWGRGAGVWGGPPGRHVTLWRSARDETSGDASAEGGMRARREQALYMIRGVGTDGF